MSSVTDFKARCSRNGVKDVRTNRIDNIKKTFLNTLKNDVSALDLKVFKVDEQFNGNSNVIRGIINDYSDNDQKAFDEKMLLTRIEDNVTYGTYILWDGIYWIVNFKEHMSVNAYNKHTIKKCNKIVKYKYKGLDYIIPVAAKNLTQYSDGLQDITYTSMPDNKISLLYGISEVTKKIELGNRVIISGNAYRTTFVEDYQFSTGYDSNSGLASSIVIYDVLNSKDDTVNEVADNKNNVEIDINNTIKGSDNVRPGGRFKYTMNDTTYKYWRIEYLTSSIDYLSIEVNQNGCYVKVTDNDNLIGQKFKLISTDALGNFKTEKILTVDGF